MPRTGLSIAAVALAATTVTAAAQGPSYESRGYGGPLYVGPNFQGGGQHSAPVYGSGPSSKERYKKKRTYRATKSRKDRAKDTDTARSIAKSKPATAAFENENSSISELGARREAPDGAKSVETAKGGIETENSSVSATSLETGAVASDASNTAAEVQPSQNVGCKKYFPTAGMTLTVPCN